MSLKKNQSEYNLKAEIEIVDHNTGAVNYLEHNCQSDLIRWHHHEECEIHLIVSTSGKMFVGDYIGTFRPGNLVLTGPHLPHNWISNYEFHTQTEIRDRVVQFNNNIFKQSYSIIPETREIADLLERAQYGIEFFGVELPKIEKEFLRIRDSHGLKKLSIFMSLLNSLVKWKDYRLLNTFRVESYADEQMMEKVNTVVNYLSLNYLNDVKLSDVAKLLKMNPSYFSRFFHKATGNRFSDFVNRLKISRACNLLSSTNKHISEIGYEVGYNNLSNFNRRFAKFKNMSPSEYRVNIYRLNNERIKK